MMINLFSWKFCHLTLNGLNFSFLVYHQSTTSYTMLYFWHFSSPALLHSMFHSGNNFLFDFSFLSNLSHRTSMGWHSSFILSFPFSENSRDCLFPVNLWLARNCPNTLSLLFTQPHSLLLQINSCVSNIFNFLHSLFVLQFFLLESPYLGDLPFILPFLVQFKFSSFLLNSSPTALA